MATSGVRGTMMSLERSGWNAVRGVDDVVRGEVAGYNVKKTGIVSELYPRMKRADFEMHNFARLPAVEGAMDFLLGEMGCNEKVSSSLRQTRRVVKQVMQDGTTRLVVVPAVATGATEVDILDRELATGDLMQDLEVPTEEQLSARTVKRTLSLSQIFDDIDATAKYSIPMRVLETAKKMAVSAPGAAAKYVQTYINSAQTVVNLTVSAKEGFFNKSMARNTLRVVGSAYSRVDSSVQASVVGDVLFMYGPDGMDGWQVYGPLKYATELSYVYWTMFHAGLIFPNVLLSIELEALGINVYDGVSSAEPSFTFHSGDGSFVKRGLAESVTRNLSATERMMLNSFSERMIPVLSSQGEQLATAIQVTGRHAVMNTHVTMADPDCVIDGAKPVVKAQLSRDIYAVHSLRDVRPWSLRVPVMHEWVFIVYLVDGELSCSEPVQIVSMTPDTLVLTMDFNVGPGVSGGAVIATTDMAFLGVHSAATRKNLLGFRFGDEQFHSLLESDSVSSVCGIDQPDDFVKKILNHFDAKGLTKVFDAAKQSLEPVFVDSVHVGTAVRSGGRLYTTCDPAMNLRFGVGHDPRVLTGNPTTALFSCRDESSMASPTYRRSPAYFEEVFVLGYDTESFMSVPTKVCHVGPDNRNFIISSINAGGRVLTGGMVMGFDGAFLGLCGPLSNSTAIGLGHLCWPIPFDRPDPQGCREILSRALNFLNVQAWPETLLEEVFVHSSVGKYDSGTPFNAGCKPLANIGDAVLKELMWIALRERNVPHPRWQPAIQAVQNNAAMAEAAWRLGYAKAMRVGPGIEMPRSSKAYADLTEALVGAAKLVESDEVVEKLAQTLGLLDVPEERTPVAATFLDGVLDKRT